jgi:hypothetical protein
LKGLASEQYQKICSQLGIDPKKDFTATKVLDKLLDEKKTTAAKSKLAERLAGKIAFVFGAGPSLERAIKQINQKNCFITEQTILIAADGAARALDKHKVRIDCIVTDLDGLNAKELERYRKEGSLIIVHAHGDNIDKLQAYAEIIQRENIIGTTQTLETKKIKNLGGFTDGDRAVALACNFNVKAAILCAFDFGTTIGKYSKPDKYTTSFPATKQKKQKLSIAKTLLAELPKDFPEITFYNYAKSDEEIPNIPTITLKELPQVISNLSKDH